jgi:hypothetical protein
MSILAFVIGISLPTISGTLLLTLLEGATPVLLRTERILLGCLIGITGTMFLTFLLQVSTHLPLALPLFLSVQIIALGILAFLIQQRRKWPSILASSLITENCPRLPLWIRIVGYTLSALLAAKILTTGIVFLLLSPTYLDDSLNNWNMRGKVFFYDRTITLVMPNENPVLSPKGISSYPPTVPLAKTWLSTLAGDWNESLINSIQLVWYMCALGLVFFAIKRQAGTAWATTGLLMMGGIPLYLIHGTNAYADVFLSAHLFAALSMLYHALRSERASDRMAFLRIAALCTGILPFTKNEATLVYLPPLLLLVAFSLWHMRTRLSRPEMRSALLWFIAPLLLIAGPWLLFKWTHGLTFGNGKPFTSLGFQWHQNVLQAIGINTFFEGNWLLLFPLLFVILIWRWRAAFSSMLILSTFFLVIYIGQIAMYVLTDLATEALRQTGYARGLVQIVPVMIFLTILLLQDGCPSLWNALARTAKMKTD